MRIRGLGTSYSDPEILCLYKQVEERAVVLCQTEYIVYAYAQDRFQDSEYEVPVSVRQLLQCLK